MEYTAESRDYKGRYAKKDSGVWAMVFGIVLLATLVLVLNHFNSARLEQYSKNYCTQVYGLTEDCK